MSGGVLAANRVLVANRGEIAVRVVRACRESGLSPVVAHSEADRESLAVQMADSAFCLGPAPSARSYLSIGAVLTAAQATGCRLLHPGYGFLSESVEFAQACEEAGIGFAGPTPATMAVMGDKATAREVAERAGLPVGRGTRLTADRRDWVAAANEVGFPLLVKASAGGGGRGIRLVTAPDQLAGVVAEASAEAQSAFGDGTLYLERYVESARHVEVQIFGDGQGNAVALGTRDCSVQRRHQKVVEEGPATIRSDLAAQVSDAAVRLARQLAYRGAGTVEFLFDRVREVFVFLEMNTRLQVEHPVTEMVTGIDIVRMQLVLALEGTVNIDDLPQQRGHAIECRITAEDPANALRPTAGRIETVRLPQGPGIRVDTWIEPGTVVSPFYDSLLMKVIAWDDDRTAAICRMNRALAEVEITGVPTNIPVLRAILTDQTFVADSHDTGWLESTDIGRAFAPPSPDLATGTVPSGPASPATESR